jgi:hypothetical protein
MDDIHGEEDKAGLRPPVDRIGCSRTMRLIVKARAGYRPAVPTS